MQLALLADAVVCMHYLSFCIWTTSTRASYHALPHKAHWSDCHSRLISRRQVRHNNLFLLVFMLLFMSDPHCDACAFCSRCFMWAYHLQVTEGRSDFPRVHDELLARRQVRHLCFRRCGLSLTYSSVSTTWQGDVCSVTCLNPVHAQ